VGRDAEATARVPLPVVAIDEPGNSGRRECRYAR
jgi:hypothetical protein